MANLTFDSAQDAFRNNPSTKTANAYARVAREYAKDEMIGEATLVAALREVDQFLISRDAA